MGFYGNISNVNKSTFQFDKIYPNRYEMDINAKNDGIFVGRYVLVDYDEGAALDIIAKWISNLPEEPDDIEPVVIANKKFAYGYRRMVYDNETESFMETDPLEFFSGIPYYNANTKTISGIKLYGKNTIEAGTYLICVGEIREKEVNIGTNEQIDIKKEYYFNSDIPKDIYAVSLEQNEVIYTKLSEVFDGNSLGNLFGSNYSINYTIDAKYYEQIGINIGRGWDSTVWQKTYKDGKVTYVMIAELNSVVPTFDIVVDAPTDPLVKPYWDAQDSSNVYYKLHLQPQFGFKIRDANGLTSWGYDEKNKLQPNLGKNYEELHLCDDKNGKAVYWFEDGFNKYYDKEPAQENNEILLELTGDSGNFYYDNDINSDTYGSLKQHVSPDTYELSIFLPKLGQSISDIWDIIYGKGSVYDTLGNVLWKKDDPINGWDFAEESKLIRNTNLEWNTRNGIRAYWKEPELVGAEGEQQYLPVAGFNKEALNSLAGTINSVHDLMGMIIIEDDIENVNTYDASNLDPYNIYYNKRNGKYYFKDKKYIQVSAENAGIDGSTMADLINMNNVYKVHTLATDNYDNIYKDEEDRIKSINNNNYYKIESDSILSEEEVYCTLSDIELNDNLELEFPNLDELGDIYKKEFNTYNIDDENSYKQTIFIKQDKDNIKFETFDYFTLECTETQALSYYVPKKYYLLKKNCANNIEKNNWEELATSSSYNLNNIEYDSITLCYAATAESAIAAAGINEDNKAITGYVFLTGVAEDPEASSFIIQDKNISEDKEISNSDIHLTIQDGKYIYSAFGQTVELLNVREKYEETVVHNEETDQDEIQLVRIGYIYNSSRYIDENYLRRENGAESSPLLTLPEWVSYWDSFENTSDLIDLQLIWIPDFQKIYLNRVYTLANAKAYPINSVRTLDGANVTNYYIRYASPDGTKEGYKQITKADIEANSNELQNATWYTINAEQVRAFYNVSQLNYYKSGNDFIKETAGLLKPNNPYQRKYYSFTANMIENPFIPNIYYHKINGVFELAQTYNQNDIYYKCPSDTVTYTWGLTEIPHFGDEINTLHGLILKVNKILLEGNELTRDRTTIQGTLNVLNELIEKFSALEPNSIVMINNEGQIRSGLINNGGDSWISVSNIQTINTVPALQISHKATETENVGEDTTTTDNKYVTNMEVSNGHITKKMRKTLPYGFKNISLGQNNSINATIPADTLSLMTDGWVTLSANQNDKQITISLTNSNLEEYLNAWKTEATEAAKTAVNESVDLKIANQINKTTIESNFWGTQIPLYYDNNHNILTVTAGGETLLSLDNVEVIENNYVIYPNHLSYGRVIGRYNINEDENNNINVLNIIQNALYKVQASLKVTIKETDESPNIITVQIIRKKMIENEEPQFSIIGAITESVDEDSTNKELVIGTPARLIELNDGDEIYLKVITDWNIDVSLNSADSYLLIEKVENLLHRVSYIHESNSINIAIPDSLVPSTYARYGAGEEIEIIDNQSSIHSDNTIVNNEIQSGTWSFVKWVTENGEDLPDKVVMPDNNIIIKGLWQFEEDPYYTVSYSYGGNNIPSTAESLPNSQKVYYRNIGDVCTIALYELQNPEIDIENDGHYSFNGWSLNNELQENNVEISDDCNFIGSWTYTEQTWPIVYSYEGTYPESAQLPIDTNTYGKNDTPVPVDPPATLITSIEDHDLYDTTNGYASGTWTFNGWTWTNPDAHNTNPIFTGNWSFEQDQSISLKYKIMYEYKGIDSLSTIIDLNNNEFESSISQSYYELNDILLASDIPSRDAEIKLGNNLYTFRNWATSYRFDSNRYDDISTKLNDRMPIGSYFYNSYGNIDNWPSILIIYGIYQIPEFMINLYKYESNSLESLPDELEIWYYVDNTVYPYHYEITLPNIGWGGQYTDADNKLWIFIEWRDWNNQRIEEPFYITESINRITGHWELIEEGE